MDSVVLLLNADYEPLNVCDLRRAFRLVFGLKAEILEYVRSESGDGPVVLDNDYALIVARKRG